MLLLYEFCDYLNFVKYYMFIINEYRCNVWKMEIFLDEKFDYKIDFFELYFIEFELYEEFNEFFLLDDVIMFGKFFE